jgi:O-antigen ligase
MIVINMLGIFQFINKGSIGGIFYYLGERAYTFLSPNVAPYPYSTFSHSNSFAGFLLVFIIFILIYKSKIDKRLFFFTLVLSLVNLFLTNSLNVWLASVLLSIMYVLKKYVRKENIKKLAFTYTLLNLDISQRFITHRLELAKASILITKENILFGVGLNNFIFKLSNMGSFYYNSWELQPVHNIFLLTLSETGIIGLISFLYFLIPVTSLSNFPLLAIIFTGMFDHYSLTLQQNMLFFVFVFVYSYKNTLKKVK